MSMLGRKKHRRRASKKKRRWKPYYMLSWEEKEQLAERESVRAARLREEMFAKGQPVAPSNTTQFLMEEHDLGEPDLSRARAGSDSSEEVISGTEGDGAADSGAEDFLKRDFRETYERLHAESLHALSKAELLRDYLELEKSLSWLEEENGKLRRRLESRGKRTPNVEVDPSARLATMQAELLKLREENHRLVEENGDLQQLMEQ